MTGADLKKNAIYLFGQTHWRTELAAWLGIHRTTIWRYVEGEVLVPQPVAAAVTARVALSRKALS